MEGTLRDAASEPGLTLIETLLWDGQRLVREDRHLARLARSAALLGWRCDGVREALWAAVPEGAARMRLTLDGAGRIEVTAAPLPPGKPVWRVGLAGARLTSDDPWLRLKSSRRTAYDAARAAMGPGLDEVIFLNERGEVCDGTITSLFFDAGEGLRTPPLASGLLPGVLREEMLETGRCGEAVLRGEDLARVNLWIGNSLRGLMRGKWAG